MIKKIVFILLIPFLLTGCGVMMANTVYYYAPSSEGGTLESGTLSGVPRFSSRDGLPDIIIFRKAGTNLEVRVVNERIIPLFGGPIIFPIIPLLPVTPFLHQKTISKDRPLVLRLHFKEFPSTFASSVRINVEEITVNLQDISAKLKPVRVEGYWNSTTYQDYDLSQALVIKPVDSSRYINLINLHYAYNGEDEPMNFSVTLNGIYVDENRIEIPIVNYTLTSDTVVATDH